MAQPLMQPEAELDQLVRQHQESLQWYLRYCGCPAAQVPDLAQETFLRLFRRLAHGEFELRSPAATASWLRRTARHLWLQSLGRRDLEPQELGEREAEEAAWLWFEGQDDGLAAREALRHCLEQLRERPRQALQLQFGEGLSRRQIARQLGLSEGGTKTLLARCRQSLRQCVEGRLSR